MGKLRNDFTQSCSFLMVGVESVAWPTDIVNKCFTRNIARCSLTCAGSLSGKNETTASFTVKCPSVTANPTAVEVKLLLSEYNM